MRRWSFSGCLNQGYNCIKGKGGQDTGFSLKNKTKSPQPLTKPIFGDAYERHFCYKCKILQSLYKEWSSFLMQPTENYYKNLLTSVISHFPKTHLALASGLALLCLGLILFPSENAEATRQTPTTFVELKPGLASDQLPSPFAHFVDSSLSSLLPSTEQAETSQAEIAVEEAEAENTAQEFVVKNGDNLSIIFQRAGLRDKDIYELFSASADAKELRKIMPGQKISFQLNDEGKLDTLIYEKNQLSSLQFTRTEKGFASKKLERVPEVRISFRQATINSSLFLAGKNAGMSNALVMELANIFAWDIDFAQDIRKGDQIKVMFEEKYLDDKKIGNGAILAVEFINQGKSYKAVRYTDSDGDSNYFTPNGESMRKAFLRMPVDFARISSHFNLNRKHPILHTIRAHKGTDYAAPRGTPVKAAGDGKVVHASTKGGYGNTVILQHGQGIKTLYAHLHNFAKGVSVGSKVKQGQVIGYVGTTGLSTGPHLHYEFYVNDVPRNPMTVELPKTVSIPAAEMAAFKRQTQPLVAQLDQFQSSSHLALADSENSVR
jgi:murein DD-endopeptidase MepM/ murein hydrolase activator NlpD